jgi:hypothetical protein
MPKSKHRKDQKQKSKSRTERIKSEQIQKRWNKNF